MEVYLVQHGEAMSEAEHAQRPLTAKGREEVRRVGVAAARMGLRPAEIRHSEKRRALETAEILGQALALPERVLAVSGLMPNDDVSPVSDMLKTAGAPIMLVSHLPFLPRLAGLLLVGDPTCPLIRFRMGGIVCLVREGVSTPWWSVGWMLTPELAC